jgi:hypothetical protein
LGTGTGTGAPKNNSSSFSNAAPGGIQAGAAGILTRGTLLEAGSSRVRVIPLGSGQAARVAP